MKRFSSICVVLSMIFMTACASAARRPSWVKGTSSSYPDQKYVIGVGIGDDLDSARSSARAEISRVFQAHVQQTMTDVQTETSASVGKKRGPAKGTQESKMKTKVMTQSLLEGVTIADTWYDKRKKKHYALAVLDKTKTRRSLTEQITDKDESIQIYLSQAKAAQQPIAQAKGFAKALSASQDRDALAARRRLVDPAGMANLSSGNSTPEIQKMLDDTLSKIMFYIDAKPAPESHLKETVSEKITELGFKITGDKKSTSTNDNPVLIVKCSLTIEPFDRGNPSWHFFKWTGSFELTEAGIKGKTMASAAPSGSDGHTMKSAAQSKTRTAGEQALANIIQKQISQYIFGEQ